MAFVLEDGTGVADANSLCSVAFADSYFTDRGITAWTGNNAVKQSKLIQATDYVETRFASRFKGEAVSDEQALSWPRENAGADNVVPAGVKKAVAEYALRALSGPLAPDPTTDASGRLVASKSEKVGPITESTTYVGSSTFLLKAYPAADMLLNPWLRRAPGLVRA